MLSFWFCLTLSDLKIYDCVAFCPQISHKTCANVTPCYALRYIKNKKTVQWKTPKNSSKSRFSAIEIRSSALQKVTFRIPIDGLSHSQRPHFASQLTSSGKITGVFHPSILLFFKKCQTKSKWQNDRNSTPKQALLIFPFR